MVVFADRAAAGRALAAALADLAERHDVTVLGLPRGGVPVAYEVARALGAPLDVIVVRKLGVPSRPELAMGAIGEGGLRVMDDDVLAHVPVTDAQIDEVVAREGAELARRVRRLRGGRDAADVRGRVAVVVDDGLATGSTARAACRVARALGAAQVVLAVPVAPVRAVHGFRDADRVVCSSALADFRAVGLHYRDFSPTTEAEVLQLLDAAARR